MKTIVIFADALTYPPKEGIAAHLFSVVQSLCDSQILRPIIIAADRGFIPLKTFANLPWQTLLLPPEIFYDYHTMECIVHDMQPDILQSYNVYQARLIAGPYSLKWGVPLVMEHHDLESELGKFLGIDPQISQANYQSQLEVATMASLNRVMSLHDFQIMTQDISAHRLATYIHLPVGIADEYVSYDWPVRKNDIMFVGNCAYPPNRQAAEFIIKHLAPILPQFTFHLFGRLTNELTEQADHNVIGHGMVDDLRPFLAGGLCGLTPISAGSGMKIKILTYISAGLPVIGTTTAFQGYADSDCLITTDLTAFAATIKRLSTESAQALHAVARRYFLDNYDVAIITRRLEVAYAKLRFLPAPTANTLPTIERDDNRLAWIHELRENTRPLVDRPTTLGIW